METTFRTAIIKTLGLVLFRKIQWQEKQRIKDVSPISNGIPVLENQVAPENYTVKSKAKAKNKVISVIGDSMIKNLNSLTV